MSTTDILSACLARLALFVASPGYPVAWPGVHLDPPNTGYWLEPRFFPNEPTNYGWDDAACINAVGFFQVLVMYRPGGGQINASDIADDVIDYFAKGQVLGPVRVYKKPHQSPAVMLDDKSYIPVTIQYRGLISIVDVSTATDVVNGGVLVTNNSIQVVNT